MSKKKNLKGNGGWCKPNYEAMNVHHRLPKSRGGANCDENLSRVPVYLHEAYNALFGSNPTPDEVALILTNVWIDPHYEIIVRLKQTTE